MKRPPATEQGFVDELAALFVASGARSPVLVGIGDDAAVLRPPRRPLVWTIDTAVDGVHFDRAWLSPEDVGARAFHAAVSDLAAMGARPLAALSNLVVPPSSDRREPSRIARGQARAARELGCPVVGGNFSRGGELSVTTTVLGTAARPLTRAGARAGDEVWLLGPVGLAGAGLLCLRRGVTPHGLRGRARRAIAACIAAWRSPGALLAQGLSLVGRARAAIDVSDGLGADAAHLARASRVRIVLERTAIAKSLPPELLDAAEMLGVDPLSLAVAGGEDYALVATGPRTKRPRSALRIGRVERGEGTLLEDPGGRQRDVARVGYDHFRRNTRD